MDSYPVAWFSPALIAPIGIEISRAPYQQHAYGLALIAPIGIEIETVVLGLLRDQLALIAPIGIEMSSIIRTSATATCLNRTYWY